MASSWAVIWPRSVFLFVSTMVYVSCKIFSLFWLKGYIDLIAIIFVVLVSIHENLKTQVENGIRQKYVE